MDKQYRQGDVFLQRVAALPSGAQKLRTAGDVILAEGEVTGHAHRIADRTVALWSASDRRYITVDREATITHEEHGPVTLEPGVYEVRIQRVYELGGEVRNVAD